MASSLETCGGTGEQMDYEEMLENALREQQLMYIANIIKETEDEDLCDLLEYTRSHLIGLLDDIADDKGNDHQIKISHRNKFAKIVTRIATKKKAESQLAASSVQFLFLSKEEEEAIETIQSGQQYMLKNLSITQELLRNLDENTDTVKKQLDSICDSLHKRIDAKQKSVAAAIQKLHEYHFQKLSDRLKVTEQSANVVAKVLSKFRFTLCGLHLF